MGKAGVALWSRKVSVKDTAEPQYQAGQQLAACQPAAERPIELVSQERPASSVGQRKAFFEAMIHSNTDAFGSFSHQPGSPRVVIGCQTNKLRSSPWRPKEVSSQADAVDQELNEVQLTFRLARGSSSPSIPIPPRPCWHGDTGASCPGSGPMSEAAAPVDKPRSAPPSQSETIAALQLELQQKERQWRADAARLQRRSREVENLTRVVSELTHGRGKLVAGRAVQAEQLARLQQEYERVLRIADLSRTVSKENVSKAACAHRQLRQVEEDLGRQKRLVAYLKENNGRLKLDNMELNERIRLLERLPLYKYGRESACMLEFTAYKLRETY